MILLQISGVIKPLGSPIANPCSKPHSENGQKISSTIRRWGTPKIQELSPDKFPLHGLQALSASYGVQAMYNFLFPFVDTPLN